MSYEETWDFHYNQTPTDQSTLTQQCRSFLQQFKTYLTGTAGWTVSQSCDSSTVSSSDLWSTLSNIVAAGSGPHSWIVMKSPEGIVAGLDGSYTGDQSRIWITLDLSYTTYYQVVVKFHNDAAPTGGTTSAAPASANQISFPTTFNRSLLNSNGKFHFISTNKGCFVAMLGFLGAGFVPFAIALFPVRDVTVINSSSLDYPFATGAYVYFADSGSGTWGYYNFGFAVLGWNYDGTVATVYKFNALATTSGYPIGYGFPATGDNINSHHMTSPIWLTCHAANKNAKVGRVTDFFASGVPTQQGSVDDATPAYCKLGDFWLPSDVVITI